jgi:hypothetical protein
LTNPASNKRTNAGWAKHAASLLAFACLFLFSAPVSRADAGAQAASTDVVIAIYQLQPDSESFRPVIADAIRYRLESRGLAVSYQAAAPNAGTIDSQAKKTGASIALSCRYSVFGSQMSITLEWRDLQHAAPPVVRVESGPLDLMLDAVILKALDGLLSSVQERVGELVGLREAATRAARAAQGAPAAKEGGVEARARAIVGGEALPAAAASSMHFLLSPGFASFIPIGAARYYFSVGLLPSLLASLEFITPSGRFAAGLYTAVSIFSASGPLDTATSFLIPLGPDFRYEIGNGSPFLAFAHVTGGVALLVMSTESQGTLSDLTGFLRSGIGVAFMFTPSFGLSFVVDYEVYFEMPYLIMGLSPTLMASFRL